MLENKTNYQKNGKYVYWQGKIPDIPVQPGVKKVLASSTNGLLNGYVQNCYSYSITNQYGWSPAEWIESCLDAKKYLKDDEPLFSTGLFIDYVLYEKVLEDIFLAQAWEYAEDGSVSFQNYIWKFEEYSGEDINGDSFISDPIFTIFDGFAFETLGEHYKQLKDKNYKKLEWDKLDFSSLNEESIDAIKWDKVDFKKAIKSSSFTIDIVDWTELNSSKAAAKAYKSIDWATASISSGGATA